jgi:hypothetical protein
MQYVVKGKPTKPKMMIGNDEGGAENVCDQGIVDEPCTRKSFLDNRQV